jgi:hypothetical protein
VRQQTEPAAVKMSEAASSVVGGSEVDTDVVQIQAPPDIGSDVHRAPPLYDISLALCQRLLIVPSERIPIQG